MLYANECYLLLLCLISDGYIVKQLLDMQFYMVTSSSWTPDSISVIWSGLLAV